MLNNIKKENKIGRGGWGGGERNISV